MKRMLSILMTGMLLIAASTGCAKRAAVAEPTMQLDMAQMVETAKGGAEAADSGGVDLYARLGAPQKVKQELTGPNGRLHVHVDAPVALPGVELPIVRTEKREFTLDEVRRFAEVLFGKDAHYTANALETPTAGYCKKQAEKLRAAIDDWDGLGNIRYDDRCGGWRNEHRLADPRVGLYRARGIQL